MCEDVINMAEREGENGAAVRDRSVFAVLEQSTKEIGRPAPMN